MKYTQTVEITPEELLQLTGNPVYAWLSTLSQPNHGELARNEEKEGDCMGEDKIPVSGFSAPYSDIYKYSVVEPYQNMQSFWNSFGTWNTNSEEKAKC